MKSSKYYAEKLSAERLLRVYEIASPRVRQYLEAEIRFVLDHVSAGDRVLELGCGCGRVLEPLSQKASAIFGIDNSQASLAFAETLFPGCFHLACMDAATWPSPTGPSMS